MHGICGDIHGVCGGIRVEGIGDGIPQEGREYMVGRFFGFNAQSTF